MVKELIDQLQSPKYLLLRRAFAVWLGRVVLKRSGITRNIPEFHELEEVGAMLEERAAQWKDEYVRLGKAEDIELGEPKARLKASIWL